MAHVLIMPRQGNTVESCVIQEWKVKEGDSVQADTTAAVVETDKATFEVPAGADGQVLKILYGDGDDVPVLEPIAVIGAAGEDWQACLGSAGTQADGAKPAGAAEPESARPPVATADGAMPDGAAPAIAGGAAGTAVGQPGAVSPRARNLAAREGLALDGVAGSGPGGRVIERDIAAALAGRPAFTAAARAAAGTIPGSVPAGSGPAGSGPAGSGLGGRVTAGDLAKNAAGPKPAQGISEYGEGESTETPVKGIRKLIADRMLSSLAESAQFTLNAAAPASRLQDLRRRMKALAETNPGNPENPDAGLAKITVNDLILFAVSRVLPAYPFMNALKIGDILKTYSRVHLGVAVDTPRGLMVPVIRNANLLSLRQISSEAKRLAAACQNGSAKAEELSGSTFTVTNLGSFGVSGFTPVLNAPEVGILGVCGIELKPVEENGDIRFEPHIGFSLTINHQVVDGAPAAKFLKALCRAVADLDLLLAAG